MRVRTPLVLFALFVVLGAVYYFLEVRRPPTPSDTRPKLFPFEQKDVTRLTLRTKEGRLTITREKEGWTLTEPLKAAGDKFAIDSLLGTLVGTRIERTIEETPSSLAPFGLEKPSLTLTLTTSAGASSTVHLGDPTPTKGSLYAKKEGEPRVVLLPEWLRGNLTKKPFDLRDKTILAVNQDNVTRIDLTSPKGRLSLEKSDSLWKIREPIAAKADSSAVRQLLWAAAGLQVKEFLEEKQRNLQKYNLNNPAVSLTLWEKDAKSPSRLLLAKAPDSARGAYAATTPARGIYLVDARVLTDLSKGVADLEDRHLFSFDYGDVSRITLTAGTTSLAMEKVKTAWRMSSPEKREVKEGKADGLIFLLRDLTFLRTLPVRGTSLIQYGLDPPRLAVTLSKADGSSVAALTLGSPRKGAVYGKPEGAASVYLLEPSLLDRIPTDPSAWTK